VPATAEAVKAALAKAMKQAPVAAPVVAAKAAPAPLAAKATPAPLVKTNILKNQQKKEADGEECACVTRAGKKVCKCFSKHHHHHHH